jgi:leucyl/phenylalanyl-tRNA--protein transferase
MGSLAGAGTNFRMSINLELLIKAYANGYFPMADARDDPEVLWVEPKIRAILPLDGLKLSKSLAKTVRQDRFRVTTDTAFAEVIARCAESAKGREETWINADIEEAFMDLHSFGRAHSIECWLDTDDGPKLVGGLYGLALRKCFFGESMFSRATDASKVALVWLIARMRIGGFQLLDCQFMTEHLGRLGAVEVPQQEYFAMLQAALKNGEDQVVSTVCSSAAGSSASSSGSSGADWGALDGFLAAGAVAGSDPSLGLAVSSSPGKFILHSLIQTS